MSFLASQIVRTKRNRIATAAVLLVGIVATAAIESRYLLNYFTGPRETSVDQLVSATSTRDLPRYYVTVHAQDLTDTGLQQITRRVDRHTGQELSTSTDASYVLLTIGGKLLLAKSDTPTNHLTGALYDVADADQIDRDAYHRIAHDNPELPLVPMLLDASRDFRGRGTAELAGMVIALALALWHLARTARARVEIRGTTEDVSRSIDAELALPDATRIGPFWLAGSWLVHCRWYRVVAVPYEHLLWAHKKVTRTKSAFVTVAKHYEVKLHDRDGREIEAKLDESQVDWLLATLGQRAPWVIVGYSDEIRTAMRRNRAAVAALVDKRMRAEEEAA